ncbi:sigma-70 family RNA polymerase sigma factor [Rhizohabitans arisaemae]|uniref:sigma-70 family RNA polymerase sigma factor n=1 Tax=Rhizohabitans arisaemae TaxID=2720610 RepID=UPI0024B174B8|nr:sigma-70 family RNA polymerase sigma factor [Rhizohabitans arisaemae]
MSDPQLIAMLRTGDVSAYGALYRRHGAAARSLARQLVRDEAEAEDVVAETFTKILDLIGRGGGPDAAFRPYLLTAIRHTVYDRFRVESRHIAMEQTALPDPGVPFVDPALHGLERTMVAKAFQSLPDRWRLVLWHTEVEGAKPAEVAPLLGLSAGGVAALAYRAREGLRRAYLQMHLSAEPARLCRPVLDKMGAYVRGGLAKRESATVDGHLEGCPECRGVFHELAEINEGLRVVVGPLIAGPMVAGYLAGLPHGGGTAVGGGLPAGEGGLLHLWRRTPGPRRALAAGTAVALLAASALVVVLTSRREPAKAVPPGAAPAAAPPPASGVKPAAPSSAVPRPTPSRPKRSPRSRPTRPPASPRLTASIEPLGALVRDRPGMIALRLRNVGRVRSGDLVADVRLPRGVTLTPAVGRGQARLQFGTVDGWSCRAAPRGARCSRRPLRAGAGTAVFLRVDVARNAEAAGRPWVRIGGAGAQAFAGAVRGVRSGGATARFAADGRVTTTAVGNALMSCGTAAAGCSRARLRLGVRRDNDQWVMHPIDLDRDPATRSSSSARLALTGQVVWAGLYWSAGGDVRVARVKVRPPGSRRYTVVRAAEVKRLKLPAGDGYQAFADVTELVRGGGRGRWWVADAHSVSGVSRYAGWSLVAVVADKRAPYSQAIVLDTAEIVHTDRRPVEIPLDGLLAAALPARMSVVAWEGDAGLAGERIVLGGKGLAPEGGDRRGDNPFDSSAEGALGPGMTFGVDVETYRGELGERPVLRLTTKRDVYVLGVVALSVPARS